MRDRIVTIGCILVSLAFIAMSPPALVAGHSYNGNLTMIIMSCVAILPLLPLFLCRKYRTRIPLAISIVLSIVYSFYILLAVSSLPEAKRKQEEFEQKKKMQHSIVESFTDANSQ